MNQVATRANTELTTTNKNAFETYSDAVSPNRIVGDLLKFVKGEYVAGQDETIVAIGTKLVANLDELMIGWVKWEDKKPTDQIIGRVAEGYTPPRRDTLGDTDKEAWELDRDGRPRDPWQLTNYLILMSVNGEQLYTFTTSSKGGLNAIGRLAGVYGKAMRQKPDDLPVITLGADSYKHEVYGKTFTPKLDVIGWQAKSKFAEALTTFEAVKQVEEAWAEPIVPKNAEPIVPKRENGRNPNPTAKGAPAETRF